MCETHLPSEAMVSTTRFSITSPFRIRAQKYKAAGVFRLILILYI
jgi:hypothetical protein